MLALALTLSVLFSGGVLTLLCPQRVNHSVTVNVAHPTSCGRYMSCVHGHPWEMHCPGGLEWNDQDSVCDYPGRSGCARDVPEEVARLNGSALAAASVCLPQEVSQCPEASEANEVAFLKHKNCRMFVTCLSDKANPIHCPQGLYWNAKTCRCDYDIDDECNDAGERPAEESEDGSGQEDPAGTEEPIQEEEREPIVDEEAPADPIPDEHDDEPLQGEPIEDHLPPQVPNDFDPQQLAILLHEPQVPYEPSRFRFRRDASSDGSAASSGNADAVDSGSSSNSADAGSSGAGSASGSGNAANSGNSASSGNSGSAGGSGSSGSGSAGGSSSSGSSGGSGVSRPVESDGPVANGADAGIRGVAAFAVMLVTLAMNAQ